MLTIAYRVKTIILKLEATLSPAVPKGQLRTRVDQVLPGVEPGLPESESEVLTITL